MSTQGLRRLVGRLFRGVRTQLRKLVLGADFERRIEALETQLHESREETWERSRVRWRETSPTPNLTWGVEVSGEAFVSKAAEYGALGPDRRVLEIGPGYGRLLAACLERPGSFRSYTGVDLSSENIAHLRKRFPQENINFVQGDAENADVGEPVDSVFSSLTFKHLFPSFEAALGNVAGQMRPGALAVFDLIEGHRRYFAEDGVSYMRHYSRAEVATVLTATGLETVAFDEVRHLPDHARLLVVARKPSN